MTECFKMNSLNLNKTTPNSWCSSTKYAGQILSSLCFCVCHKQFSWKRTLSDVHDQNLSIVGVGTVKILRRSRSFSVLTQDCLVVIGTQIVCWILEHVSMWIRIKVQNGSLESLASKCPFAVRTRKDNWKRCEVSRWQQNFSITYGWISSCWPWKYRKHRLNEIRNQ